MRSCHLRCSQTPQRESRCVVMCSQHTHHSRVNLLGTIVLLEIFERRPESIEDSLHLPEPLATEALSVVVDAFRITHFAILHLCLHRLVPFHVEGAFGWPTFFVRLFRRQCIFKRFHLRHQFFIVKLREKGKSTARTPYFVFHVAPLRTSRLHRNTIRYAQSVLHLSVSYFLFCRRAF